MEWRGGRSKGSVGFKDKVGIVGGFGLGLGYFRHIRIAMTGLSVTG